MLTLSGCASGDATEKTGPAPTSPEEAVEAPATEDSQAPQSTPSTHAPACERVTPEELSSAFNVTFSAGEEPADNVCVFSSDASYQVRVQVYPGKSATCSMLGADYEQVEIAGNPGWWDGAQARACMPDESVALMLAGGEPNNPTDRTAMLDLTTLAANR